MKSFLIVLTLAAAVLAGPSGILKRRQDPCEPNPDPHNIMPGLLNLSLSPVIVIDMGGTHEEVMITGHSTIVSEVEFILATSNVNFEITIPSIDIVSADYQATGFLDVRPLKPDTFPSGNFTAMAGGSAKIALTNVMIKGTVNVWVILITNKVQLRNLNIEMLDFDTVTIDLGTEIMIGGVKPDFAAINADLKADFFADWTTDKQGLLDKLLVAANIYISDWTLEELLDLILNPDCPKP